MAENRRAESCDLTVQKLCPFFFYSFSVTILPLIVTPDPYLCGLPPLTHPLLLPLSPVLAVLCIAPIVVNETFGPKSWL